MTSLQTDALGLNLNSNEEVNNTIPLVDSNNSSPGLSPTIQNEQDRKTPHIETVDMMKIDQASTSVDNRPQTTDIPDLKQENSRSPSLST